MEHEAVTTLMATPKLMAIIGSFSLSSADGITSASATLPAGIKYSPSGIEPVWTISTRTVLFFTPQPVEHVVGEPELPGSHEDSVCVGHRIRMPIPGISVL